MNLIDVAKQFATPEACNDFLGSMRWPDAIKVGSQDVEVTTDLLAPQIGTTFSDLLADSLATNNSMTFTLVGGASGTTTLTVALANLSRASMPIPFKPFLNDADYEDLRWYLEEFMDLPDGGRDQALHARRGGLIRYQQCDRGSGGGYHGRHRCRRNGLE